MALGVFVELGLGVLSLGGLGHLAVAAGRDAQLDQIVAAGDVRAGMGTPADDPRAELVGDSKVLLVAANCRSGSLRRETLGDLDQLAW